MKNLLYISLLIIGSSFAFGQNSQIKRTNHWFFGNKAGIDFTSGTAVADTSGEMIVFAGNATISDTSGNLLMYTNGQTVWNSQHDTMPNGINLYGVGTPVQSSIIVPKPLDDNIYYIFTCAGTDGVQYGIRYSIVDMTLNGGLGDVTLKNELLFQPSTEQLAATMHSNCQDVWIMGHETNSNKFRAYQLTQNGIDSNNVVINNIGNLPQLPNTTGIGLKFSNNGKKMAAVNYWDNWNNPTIMDTLELFDFNKNTGIITNRIAIADSLIDGFGFSPNDSVLYTSGGSWDAQTYQWDISSNNQFLIESSKTLLYYADYYSHSDFQITPDNKMIVAMSYRDTISIIDKPNLTGLSCDLIIDGIDLLGRTCYTKLPNFIASYFDLDTNGCFYINALVELSQLDFKVLSYPNPFTDNCTVSVNFNIGIPSGLTDIDINLIDLYGRDIGSNLVYDLFATSTGFDIKLKRKNLNPGTYFLEITLGNEHLINKLIITD